MRGSKQPFSRLLAWASRVSIPPSPFHEFSLPSLVGFASFDPFCAFGPKGRFSSQLSSLSFNPIRQVCILHLFIHSERSVSSSPHRGQCVCTDSLKAFN